MKKFFKNKRGVSVSTGLIYGLATLFGLTVLYVVVVEYAIIGNLLPIFKNILSNGSGIMLSPSDQTTVLDNWERLVFMIRLVPSVLFFVVVIFMFVIGIQKEREDIQYG